MDPRRFDQLARDLATGRSRRSFLKGLGAALAGAVAAGNLHARLEIMPRSGHWIPLDNPAGFVGAFGDILTNF